DRSQVESFVDSLAKYASVSKNQVGLGIIVGEDISPEAKESVSKFISERRRLPINHLLLIDRPSSSPARPLHSTDEFRPYPVITMLSFYHLTPLFYLHEF